MLLVLFGYRYLKVLILVLVVNLSIAQSSDIRIESNLIAIPLSGLGVQKISVYKGCITKNEVTGLNPISGNQRLWRDSLVFEPIVPFSKSQDYSVLRGDAIHCFQLRTPADYAKLEIAHIYPSSKLVPANFLKWYIEFSRPVNPANIYEHIRLLDDDGRPMERAILKLESALLNSSGNMLTVWVEPGRQKRNLGPNLELGPVFIPGEEYELVIDAELKDASGITMGTEWRHRFLIARSERTLIDLKKWVLSKPRSESMDELTIKLENPVDFGSSIGSLTITNTKGGLIEGEWKLQDFEQTLIFVPNKSWDKGTYLLHVSESLEDLAGNRIHRLFDQPVSTKGEVNNYVNGHTIKFQVF